MMSNPAPPPFAITPVEWPAAAAGSAAAAARPSRYESQKRRDWHTFGQYLRNHRPPLELGRCSGAHVLEFLRYLDQFGKTKVHAAGCPFFGHPAPPAPCACPLRQAWGSLDALVGRLRAAFEEHGGAPETNPFGSRAVRIYLREVRDNQAKARGIIYEKKRRRKRGGGSPGRQPRQADAAVTGASADSSFDNHGNYPHYVVHDLDQSPDLEMACDAVMGAPVTVTASTAVAAGFVLPMSLCSIK